MSQAHGHAHSHAGHAHEDHSQAGHAHEGHVHEAHAHDAHAPRHAPHRRANRRRLTIVLAIMAVYMIAEAAGGFATGSLALLADSGHMLSDVAALGLTLFAIRVADRPATARRTYGYHRVEILAALANGAILCAISILIFVEAAQRLRTPEPVEGGWMLAIASGGLVANLAGLWLLHEHKDHSLNTHAAWLHVLSDALGSAGAIASACLILAFGWTWADPVASIIIGLLVIRASWSLVKETVGVLMEDAPGHIDVDDVRRAMLEVEGVRDVRDLHVWSITSGLESLSAHVFVDDAGAHHRVLCATREMLCERFGIEHVTIQVELREELAGS